MSKPDSMASAERRMPSAYASAGAADRWLTNAHMMLVMSGRLAASTAESTWRGVPVANSSQMPMPAAMPAARFAVVVNGILSIAHTGYAWVALRCSHVMCVSNAEATRAMSLVFCLVHHRLDMGSAHPWFVVSCSSKAHYGQDVSNGGNWAVTGATITTAAASTDLTPPRSALRTTAPHPTCRRGRRRGAAARFLCPPAWQVWLHCQMGFGTIYTALLGAGAWLK